MQHHLKSVNAFEIPIGVTRTAEDKGDPFSSLFMVISSNSSSSCTCLNDDWLALRGVELIAIRPIPKGESDLIFNLKLEES